MPGHADANESPPVPNETSVREPQRNPTVSSYRLGRGFQTQGGNDEWNMGEDVVVDPAFPIPFYQHEDLGVASPRSPMEPEADPLHCHMDIDFESIDHQSIRSRTPVYVGDAFGVFAAFGNEFTIVHRPTSEMELRELLFPQGYHPERSMSPMSMAIEVESSNQSSMTTSSIFSYRSESPCHLTQGINGPSESRVPRYFSLPPLRLTYERRFCHGATAAQIILTEGTLYEPCSSTEDNESE